LVSYTVGGTVSGLKGLGLTLGIIGVSYTRPHAIQQLSVNTDSQFVFPASIYTNGPDPGLASISGAAFDYAVDITQQPASPMQHCVPSDKYGIFTISANITDLNVACGEFLHSINTIDGTVSAFSIDAYTGALASVGPSVAAGRSPHAQASTAGKSYVYVANGDSNDVSAFAADPRTGGLTRIAGSPFAAGSRPQAVAIYRSSLFVANAGSDTLSVYRVDPKSGVPAPWSRASYPTGVGPSLIAIANSAGGSGLCPTTYGATISTPVLYVANAGSNDISAYLLLGACGPDQALQPVQGSPFASGSSVSSLAFGSRFLYAANASGANATLSAFAIDPNSAALTGVAGFPMALPFCNYVATDRTGKYLYATVGTTLSGYSINAQTGALGLLPGFPLNVGARADSITIDPANQFLYVRSGSAGTVTGFQLNAATGALTLIPGSPFVVGRTTDFIATF
jgi:6-phosphogluconolactonase (cycloisomerase 2 family)